MRAWEASSLVTPESATIEEVVAKAALTAGADIVLFEEQLPAATLLSSDDDQFSAEQLQKLETTAAPFLQVE